VGFVVEKVALQQVFSEYFGFPLLSFILPVAPQSSSSIIWGWYSRPVVAAVPSGLSLTPLTPIIIIIIIIIYYGVGLLPFCDGPRPALHGEAGVCMSYPI
jgi:hypothetical protein